MPIIDNAPPPTKRGPGRPRKTPPPQASPKHAEYTQTVSAIFTMGALVTGMVGQHADAVTIAEHSERLAPAIAENALKNEALAKALDAMNTTGGPWVELLVLTLPFTMQILVNHGVIKPSPQMGTVPAEVQTAKAAVAMREAQQEAQRAMDAAMAELQTTTRQETPAA